ncbi:putative Holliday junction resolvase [Hasllibacter halocynthiae]|uniref:Putative pre-16S rRNA nuclease n=1 Tax=Hasllibacter halocynthiae TaxID=595589 RepID=A0A2T0X934_9RHOB|nr:Holliday junction resolvase RuvX [Hasllibacter halocynthiae]PRY95425.1 putative Holliday junction resolvase [Hasllibacter halocynthiae]
MICETAEEFAALLPPAGALIGLDPGTKTIGVAVSDGLRSVASPLETIRRTKFTPNAERILVLAQGRGVAGIVIGLPRNMDGTEGPRAQAARGFARNLGRLAALPLAFWDERLSTVAAERAMIEADTSRAKRAERIDSVAASYILQGMLDRLRYIG